MTMEKCAVCGKTGNEVRLFDGIYVNEMSKICERCSLVNGIPIVKLPSLGQLKDSEKPYSVRARLSRMAHLSTENKTEKPIYQQLKELEENPALEKPSEDELVFNLVDNFHWVIQTARRRQGLTAKQLAETLGESESAINLLERKIIPRGALDLLVRMEQLLKIKIIKKDLSEIEKELKKQKERQAFEAEKANYLAKKESEENSEAIPFKEPDRKLSPEILSLRDRESKDFKIRELKRESDKIESDFNYTKKTREEVGKEQIDSFGKEDMGRLKRNIEGTTSKKAGTPSIYDLMKKKEERDKFSITGKDIEVVEEPKKFQM